MVLKLANNASSTLSANILSTDTTISVQTADASKFPSLSVGDWFPLTLVDTSNNIEIVKVTARSGATLTVTRAQEGTTARDYSAGDAVALQLTAAVMADKGSQADLDLKAPLASPDLTGNPTAPTQEPDNNSTRIATTAFVAAALAALSSVNGVATTGDTKQRYGTGTHAGWVRMNALTIGSADSGATERANDDCEALFTFLWQADPNLAVSGGRGADAATDWAADKTIALPDARERVGAGLADMGNAAAGRIADGVVDGAGDSSTLGATAGESEHALTTDEMPAHDHGGETGNAGSHSHSITIRRISGSVDAGNKGWGSGNEEHSNATNNTDTAPDHKHSIASEGGGAAHNNLQPTLFMTWYIKL